MSSALSVRAWTVEEFASSRDVWQEILARSGADPLFMSWDWQWRWWTHHAKALGATLHLLGVYANDGTLLGLAPFYSHEAHHRGSLRSVRLELIGLAWRSRAAVFSEYLDMIASPEHADAVLSCVAEWLAAQTFWHDLVLACTKSGSLASRLAHELLNSIAHVRVVDPMTTHCVELPAHFGDYVDRLNDNTRRKLFHQRHKLADPAVVHATERDIGDYLDWLGRFTAARWNVEAESVRNRSFHLDFATAMAQANRLRLTRLDSGGRPLSIMYNVRCGDVEYYLQSGFDSSAARGLSPGYLHFGYAIEAACNASVTRLDLLGGRGRHRDYKGDLLTERSPLESYHAIRSPGLRALYAAHDLLKRVRRTA